MAEDLYIQSQDFDCETTEQWLQRTLDCAKSLSEPDIRPCDDPKDRRLGLLVEDPTHQYAFWLPVVCAMTTTKSSDLHTSLEERGTHPWRSISGIRGAKSRAEMARRLLKMASA